MIVKHEELNAKRAKRFYNSRTTYIYNTIPNPVIVKYVNFASQMVFHSELTTKTE